MGLIGPWSSESEFIPVEYEGLFAFIHSHFLQHRDLSMPTDVQPRKEPKQERSRQLRTRILDASLRVLREEGALGFTTTRVADEAGVSVGSLYQYFPNKHALVMALHDDDIRQGIEHICTLLDRTDWSPRHRLTEITQWFFTTEAQEVAEYGSVIGDIEVFLRAGSEAGRSGTQALLETATKKFESFIVASSARTWTPSELRFTARFVWTTIETLGKSAAAARQSTTVNRRWATETADMLAGHLRLTDSPLHSSP
jgi:AcrR family transcriptional regulator